MAKRTIEDTEEWKKNEGRLKKLSKKERVAIAAKGGKASAGIPKVRYRRCNECTRKNDCAFFEKGARCKIEVQLRKKLLHQPEQAFLELGLDNPKKFFARLAKDVLILREGIADRGESPSMMMGYIDRMINLAKLIYGEKHLNINVQAKDDSQVLSVEKLLKERRKLENYNPKTGEGGDDIVDAEYEVSKE